ncbi:lamin tail domain-containing protein [Candidatus Woesearchaeota archaeon]|nr:lamin tail domain-containing protein [Candidatus Woesearchaeota archaeon]
MKKIVLLLIVMLLPALVRGSLVISEVLYDPITSEAGGEFVELYNPTPEDINVGGWVLATESSQTDVVFPANTLIRANSYFLVADAGWSTGKDNASWPDADYEEAITLGNTDAGVALKNGTTTIDAVGWGNPSNISAGLFEGSPVDHVAPGHALVRNNPTTETHNNTLDFVEAVPTPKNSESQALENSTSSRQIAIALTVAGSLPHIVSAGITDDNSLEGGSQIVPTPGLMRNITINATVSDQDGNTQIVNVTAFFDGQTVLLQKKQNINTTDARYEGTVFIPYFQQPGNYTVTYTTEDSTSYIATSNITVTIAPLLAFAVDASNISFAASPNNESTILGDKELGTQSLPTLSNYGNVPLDIGLRGTDLSGPSTIPVENIDYTLSANDFSSELSGSLSKTMATIPLNLGPGWDASNELAFRIRVPAGILPGSYNGNIMIAAVSR